MKKMTLLVLILVACFFVTPVAAAVHITAYDYMRADQAWLDTFSIDRELFVDGIPVIDGAAVVAPLVTWLDVRSFIQSKPRHMSMPAFREVLSQVDRRVVIRPMPTIDIAYELDRLYGMSFVGAWFSVDNLTRNYNQDTSNILWVEVLSSVGLKAPHTDYNVIPSLSGRVIHWPFSHPTRIYGLGLYRYFE